MTEFDIFEDFGMEVGGKHKEMIFSCNLCELENSLPLIYVVGCYDSINSL